MREATYFVFLVAITELWLSARWSRSYFTRGIVVYRRTAQVPVKGIEKLTEESLSKRFRGAIGPSLVFHVLADSLIAFREPVFELRLFTYTPVMRGLLRIRPESCLVDVEGRANWFMLVFVAYFVAFSSFDSAPWFILGFLLALLGAIYGVQAARFGKVARELGVADQWTAGSEGSSVWNVRVPHLAVLILFVVALIWWFSQPL